MSALSADQDRYVSRGARNTFGITGENKAGRTWAGAQRPDGFTVATDFYYPSLATRLIVSTSPTLANPVFASPLAASAPSAGVAGLTYHSAKVAATGLAPDTRQYYGFEIDGRLDLSRVRSVKTAPAAGSAASFRFAFGSCTSLKQREALILPAIAAMDPLFFLHTGDLTYANNARDDTGKTRGNTTRAFRDNPWVDQLLASVAIIYTTDNHDTGDAAFSLDSAAIIANGVDPKVVAANSRRVYRETTPHYPLVHAATEADPDKVLLAQQWDVGRVRFLMPDMMGQQRKSNYTAEPSMLGHNQSWVWWDQFAWLTGALTQAGADGMKLVFLVSSRAWNVGAGAATDGWYRNSAERTAIHDFIKANPGLPRIVILDGDAHTGGADDGTNNDFATGGGAPIPLLRSSPLFNASIGYGDPPFSWAGVGRMVPRNLGVTVGGVFFGSHFATVDVIDAGSSATPEVRCGFYGYPIDSVTYAPTLVFEVSTAELVGW